ncbi:alpha-keto acid decarboxylase family protein [Swaminathania salitolerans]|uniref:pyruvate decarboxylase n=1 Tax=Swaminathania salitolerans TaxID=182838 RepID=A0A511BUX1_9PROT|nr:thiamine pyrophosphate-binding protein [Swaminathania salitolerans]GEL01768.1 pyruvate decarboxylase [Swaminathania salitolerans]
MSFTVGQYLAERLRQIGLRHHFAVAGDYNLVLLDQLLTEKSMQQVYCCNELNCGFSAEGYARAHGAAAAVVTFGVGTISAMDALAGAYAENLPVILVVGGLNSNDRGSGRVLHHTTGTTDHEFQLQMARQITCAAESINDAASAPAKIDHVIRAALLNRKPVYLEIACNISDAECVRPGPASSFLRPINEDRASLVAAIETTRDWLKGKQEIVLLVGSKIRAAMAQKAAIRLADRLPCSVAIMAAAKSFFPETHPAYAGLYWGEVSDPGVADLVEKADAVLCLAPVFNDYSTVGWTAWPRGESVLTADPDRVTVAGRSFDGFTLESFLEALADSFGEPRDLQPREVRPFAPEPAAPDARLTNDEMLRQIQRLVSSETTLTAETGDSWFNAMRLGLPEGAQVEVEMQWGHIGWSVPSTFGQAVAAPDRRHVLMVGDGSFQLTAQEVGQMIRYELPVIIFLVNNRGYVIEIAIHDGPYNYIQNWDYAALMAAFNGGTGHGLGLHAGTGAELEEAIEKAVANRRGPTLIECSLDREDCTEMLRKWGKVVAKTNARAPQQA